MISTEDLYSEINKIEDLLKQDNITELESAKATIKLNVLQTKLLHNLRTNSVKIMKHFNIETVKPKQRYEEKK